MNASENLPTADEIVAAVTRLQDQRDELRDKLAATEVALERAQRFIDELSTQGVVVHRHPMPLPGGRRWTFFEDGPILGVSPDIDEVTVAHLLAQVEPPRLTTCAVCGAPVFVGQACGMHS